MCGKISLGGETHQKFKKFYVVNVKLGVFVGFEIYTWLRGVETPSNSSCPSMSITGRQVFPITFISLYVESYEIKKIYFQVKIC